MGKCIAVEDSVSGVGSAANASVSLIIGYVGASHITPEAQDAHAHSLLLGRTLTGAGAGSDGISVISGCNNAGTITLMSSSSSGSSGSSSGSGSSSSGSTKTSTETGSGGGVSLGHGGGGGDTRGADIVIRNMEDLPTVVTYFLDLAMVRWCQLNPRTPS